MKHNIDDTTLQAAIDEACKETAQNYDLWSNAIDLTDRNDYWTEETSARLALAKAFLARLIAAARGPINLESAIGATPGSFARTCDDSKTGEMPSVAGLQQTGPKGAPDLKGPGLILEPVELPVPETPWIEWHGGECPLKDDEVEEWDCKLRNGKDPYTKGNPSDLRWTHKADDDITAYRVLKWRERPDDVDWKAKFETEKRAHDHALGAIKKLRARAEKAEVELAKELKRSFILESRNVELDVAREQLEIEIDRLRNNPSLSRLRPLAEAGPVPAGAVRVFAQPTTIVDRWSASTHHSQLDTHYADILPPEASQPAVEAEQAAKAAKEIWDAAKPEQFIEPDTFTSHADKPTPEPAQPWQPAVGDVVTLKGGGPKMTVTHHDADETICIYNNAGDLKIVDLPTSTLQPA